MFSVFASPYVDSIAVQYSEAQNCSLCGIRSRDAVSLKAGHACQEEQNDANFSCIAPSSEGNKNAESELCM